MMGITLPSPHGKLNLNKYFESDKPKGTKNVSHYNRLNQISLVLSSSFCGSKLLLSILLPCSAANEALCFSLDNAQFVLFDSPQGDDDDDAEGPLLTLFPFPGSDDIEHSAFVSTKEPLIRCCVLSFSNKVDGSFCVFSVSSKVGDALLCNSGNDGGTTVSDSLALPIPSLAPPVVQNFQSGR
ncbi:hypothetical protein OROHE_013807 [Orobanche hederae]